MKSYAAINGYYGQYGGRFVPEILIPAMEELNRVFEEIRRDESFYREYYQLLMNYSGRPTPLTYAAGLTDYFGRARIFIKREYLNHSGAHKINNVLGQGLVMQRLGKTRVIAETGAGQHGVATATMAAKLGFKATIYMGAEDVARQYANVFWMKPLGAEVIPVTSGTATLKDAINEAFKDWAGNFDTTHYALGTACGARPFPEMVTFFQSVIGREIKRQAREQLGRNPDRIYACLGGGSNAMGAFADFLEDQEVELIAVEAGGKGKTTGRHASRIAYGDGRVGICQGYKTLFSRMRTGRCGIPGASQPSGLCRGFADFGPSGGDAKSKGAGGLGQRSAGSFPAGCEKRGTDSRAGINPCLCRAVSGN
jgi:tryptophan synthase beta chain